MSHLICPQAGCIVSTYFISTCTQRSSTVKLTDNHIRIGCKATFEVRAYRSNKNNKHIFASRMNTYLSSCSDQQRTDIQGCSTFIRRNKPFIRLDNHFHSLTEFLSRQLRHQNSATCTLQTFCICIRTENTDLAIFSTISLQAFKSFLTIMQASCCHVNIQSFFWTKFQFTPLSVAIITTDVVICLHIAKWQISPINFFHYI